MDKKKFLPLVILLQPTPFCNINCSYCYLWDRDRSVSMQQETLREIFRSLGELVDGPRSIDVIWHAGEPMVLGPDWYRKSFKIVADSAPDYLNLHHGIQTNGTLISAEWCDLINEHRVGLGISIDGPEDIHDTRRRTRRGAGTHKRLMLGLELLQKHDIDYGALCVITEYSVTRPEECLNFSIT